MCHPVQFARLEHVLKLFGGLLQVGHSCTELPYKSISRVSYLQLLPDLSMDGDVPPFLLPVFMVCTRTALPFLLAVGSVIPALLLKVMSLCNGVEQAESSG